MEQKNDNCKDHESPLTIYCEKCQKMICVLCITDHSMKGHQLMSPIDFSKNILKPQICEQLAVISEKRAKPEVQSFNKDITACISSLEALVGNLTQELDALRGSLALLKIVKETAINTPWLDYAERSLKSLIEEIGTYSKEKDVSAAIRCEEIFNKIVDTMKAPNPVEHSEDTLKIALNLIQEMSAKISTKEIRTVIDKLSVMIPSGAKCCGKFIDEYEKKLWKIDSDGRACRKYKDDSYITICVLDTPMCDGVYQIEYCIEKLTSEDRCDSIGIISLANLGSCAFNGSSAYGLFNGYISAENATEKLANFKYKEGDIVKLIYSASLGSLAFHINGKQLGSTIVGIPKKEYYAGIAFRKTGTVIKLLEFFQY